MAELLDKARMGRRPVELGSCLGRVGALIEQQDLGEVVTQARPRLVVGAGDGSCSAGRDGGGEMTIGYEIVELVEPELLVMRLDPMPEVGMDEGTVVRVELHDHGEKTRMTLSADRCRRAAALRPKRAGTRHLTRWPSC